MFGYTEMFRGVILFGCDMLLRGRRIAGLLGGSKMYRSAARMQAVQEWYDTALSEEQSALLVLPEGFGKVAGDSSIAAALAALVRHYPPDWIRWRPRIREVGILQRQRPCWEVMQPVPRIRGCR